MSTGTSTTLLRITVLIENNGAKSNLAPDYWLFIEAQEHRAAHLCRIID